jgi:hypothetical protein
MSFWQGCRDILVTCTHTEFSHWANGVRLMT